MHIARNSKNIMSSSTDISATFLCKTDLFTTQYQEEMQSFDARYINITKSTSIHALIIPIFAVSS